MAIVSAEVVGDKPSTQSWAYEEAREESCVGGKVGYSGSKGMWDHPPRISEALWARSLG